MEPGRLARPEIAAALSAQARSLLRRSVSLRLQQRATDNGLRNWAVGGTLARAAFLSALIQARGYLPSVVSLTLLYIWRFYS